jgi:hypothetical protein
VATEDCTNQVDDDCDGQMDCADSQCSEGTKCAGGNVCRDHKCLGPCIEGMSCSDNPNKCTTGRLACSSATPVCVDGPSKCGADQVCQDGQCIAQCGNGPGQKCCKGDIRECFTDCGKGSETCDGNGWIGCNAPQPAKETCNGRDDNCKGGVDEGNLCSDDQVCMGAAGCKQACGGSGQPCCGGGGGDCNGGLVCNGATCQSRIDDGKKCSPSTAVLCKSGFCTDGVCCRTSNCPTGAECSRSGECLLKAGQPCGAAKGAACSSGRCSGTCTYNDEVTCTLDSQCPVGQGPCDLNFAGVCL